jgi:hypothetical protein
LLSLAFAGDRRGQFGIGGGEVIVEKTGGMLGQWRDS